MSKSVYLDKIRNKEFGGDKQSIKIKEVIMSGTTASALVELVGAKATLSSLLTLVEGDGQWKVVADCPIIK
jgi:hypothetical protein